MIDATDRMATSIETKAANEARVYVKNAKGKPIGATVVFTGYGAFYMRKGMWWTGGQQ